MSIRRLVSGVIVDATGSYAAAFWNLWRERAEHPTWWLLSGRGKRCAMA